MTRDEAKKTLEAMRDNMQSGNEVDTMIDAFVKLGMLRLDDDRSAYSEMLDIARAYLDDNSAITFGKELTSKGIKVVRA